MSVDLGPVAPTARNVSNSEVTTFLSCKRQYKYAFLWELEPLKTGDPLARGSVFHLGMELYWTARLEGKSHEESMAFATQAFAVCPEGYTLEMVMQAQFLWVRYMNHHNGFPDIEPLGTERKLILPITSTLNISIKYDFYYRQKSTGKCYILDYKLAYEFWKQDDHDLNGQMPKYVAVLQANGFQVDGGKLEEIRTRELGKEKASDPKNLWRTTDYSPSFAKKRAVLAQHIAASMEIEKFRATPVEELPMVALPVLNKHGVCKFCNFKDLCNSENEGKTDLTVDIRVGYRSNTYSVQHNERDSQHVNF